MTIKVPSYDDDRTLRVVELEGYVLHTWDTYERGRFGKCQLGYAFYRKGEEEPIFIGEDFFPSPLDCIDSDASLRCLLGFLTLREGDTDDEYFADYTDRQIEFRDFDAEMLSLWAMDPEADDCTPQFTDLLEV